MPSEFKKNRSKMPQITIKKNYNLKIHKSYEFKNFEIINFEFYILNILIKKKKNFFRKILIIFLMCKNNIF